MEDVFFIQNNIPSLKNSKVSTSKGVFSSPVVQKFLRSYGIKYYSSGKKVVEGYKTIPMTFPADELRELFKESEWPIEIGFHFVRSSRRRFDFVNAVQIILDMFTAFDIIPDDSMDFVTPRAFKINDKFYSYDKNNPGVYVKIIKNDSKNIVSAKSND